MGTGMTLLLGAARRGREEVCVTKRGGDWEKRMEREGGDENQVELLANC